MYLSAQKMCMEVSMAIMEEFSDSLACLILLFSVKNANKPGKAVLKCSTNNGIRGSDCALFGNRRNPTKLDSLDDLESITEISAV